ncbi:MAG: hypothetical protein PUC06_10950 [Oscillospiraceae bacterium]|nr:hypothetical protein [Oscillospiraceae bacterium]
MQTEKKTERTLFLTLRALIVTLLVVFGLIALRHWGIIGEQTDLTLAQVESLLGRSI